jgi:hypothetical protein
MVGAVVFLKREMTMRFGLIMQFTVESAQRVLGGSCRVKDQVGEVLRATDLGTMTISFGTRVQTTAT